MSSSEILPFKETGHHSFHRRAFAHDYYSSFIYHIIINKQPGFNNFGSVEGDARIPFGNPGCARIKESELGKIIAKNIIHLPYEFPIIKLHKFCVMPDHVHMLIQILFRSDKHLDFYMDYLMERIASKYSALTGTAFSVEDIFVKGYCDKPLYDNRSLNGLYIYIEQNPHRLAMRQQQPQFFTRMRHLRIEEKEYEAYGNLFLLRNPDKAAVKISRKFSPDEKAELKESWLTSASTGTVLVSPFIHAEEKEIRSKAEELGAKIILITHTAFGERYKPGARDFALCEEGRLLIISLGLPPKTDLSRSICNRMNDLAKTICSNSY